MYKEKVFGFELVNKELAKEKSLLSPVELSDSNGMPIGGAFTTGHLVDYRFKSESDLINMYRDMSLHSEVEYAIDEILNECFVYTGRSMPVSIQLKDTGLPKELEKKIRDEFHNILRLLSFKTNSYEIFKRWYVDGRVCFHIILDPQKPREGIKEIRFVDPLQIKHVKEPLLKTDDKGNYVYSENELTEYYEYYPLGVQQGLRSRINIAKDSMVVITSGLYDRSRGIVLSHLDKAIKPLNNLRHIEDSNVIHTMARAPMRRAFYLDVDGMPAAKAEQYMRESMARYRNKVDYDPKTGAILDQRKYQAMLEDYWMPVRNGSSAKIENIEGAGDLMEMPMVQYFKRNLYQSLNVPIGRLEPSEGYNWGADAEISREEIKFSKFINRLRQRFSTLFDEILRIQLSAKGIMPISDWAQLEPDVHYEFVSDLHYQEMQTLEILGKRLDALDKISEHVGTYYSDSFVRKNVLGQDEQAQEDMKKEIEDSKKKDEEEMKKLDISSNVNPDEEDDDPSSETNDQEDPSLDLDKIDLKDEIDLDDELEKGYIMEELENFIHSKEK